MLEGRSIDEIARLNLYYTQTGATLEYDGAVIQDLAGAASCFLGSELQVESRADVAREDAMVGDGDTVTSR